MLSQWLWIIMNFAEQVVVNHCVMLIRVCGNHGVLFLASGWESRCECRASGCESWWARLSQWLWITMCYYVQVGMHHGELWWVSGCDSCCASRCEPWRVMLNHWLWIIEFCWASGCAPLWVILRQWVWIMVCYAEPVVVNHGVLFSSHMCEPWWGMLSQKLTIIVYYTEPVVLNHFGLCWNSDCESWCAMISKCVGIMVCYSEPVVGNHGVNAVPVCVNHNELCGNNGWESLRVILCQ
jgi:hypothetical protein